MSIRTIVPPLPLPVALASLLALASACDGAHDDRAEEAEASSAVATLAGPLSGADLARFLRGRRLFFEETFGGNGRTCETCHLRNAAGDNFDFTPADAQAIFAANPADPLFRAIDADDGVGDYTTLLTHGLVRIPFVLPDNVTVDELDSPLVDVDAATGRITVSVLRSTPSIENIALEESLMWDGRFGADLERQAREAVATHNQPARLPTAAEAGDLAFFQRRFFTNAALRVYANGYPPPELPAVPQGTQWASARRGRGFFVSQGPIDAGHRGLCATCHSGAMLDTTDAFNPVQPAGERISNNFVSETNTTIGVGLPELTYRITLQHDLVMPPGTALPIPPGIVLAPAGTVVTLRSSDPGRILSTGDPCELPLSCVINPGSTTSFFRTSSLWGVADTAPYFHDNSAATLEQVMDVYQFLFAVTAAGLGNPAFVITDQDRADILAYMRFAFRRHAVSD